MEFIEYSEWFVHPQIVDTIKYFQVGATTWQKRETKHEGEIVYMKYWNFWVRAGVSADQKANMFFQNYEMSNNDIKQLLMDIEYTWNNAMTEEEVWDRIGMVWNWCKTNVSVNNSEYGKILPPTGSWPSILDYADYYAKHKKLVWAACFSKAHLFLTLLGRMLYPRYRLGIAEAHHTEGGAPPTATHVYAAVYVAERWFYFDPAAVYNVKFPDFKNRKSIGVSGFSTVDYEHPYNFIPLPKSGFDCVPYLPK